MNDIQQLFDQASSYLTVTFGDKVEWVLGFIIVGLIAERVIKAWRGNK